MQLVLTEDQELLAKTAADFVAENSPVARMRALRDSGDKDGFSSDEINLTRAWLRSRGNSIEGGTSEVQLNIIAKRVLGLPD